MSEQQQGESRRLFFALWPDQEVRERLATLLESLAPQGGRAVADSNLHLTLAFLGQVSPQQQSCMEAWADGLHVPRLSLTLDHLGYWPQPRVVWLGPSRWSEALDHLVGSLVDGMHHCGLTPDPRPYIPHVTLMRKARGLPDWSPSSICWCSEGLVLCESCTGANGLEYRVLRHWSA